MDEEQDIPQESGMDLFNRMLEKQLQEEEERMKKAGIPIPTTSTSSTTARKERTVPQRKKPVLSKNFKQTDSKIESSTEPLKQQVSIQDVAMTDATTIIPQQIINSKDNEPISSAPQNEDTNMTPQESSMEIFEKLLQQQLKQEENDLNEESSFDKMPIKERLKHKNWKARLSAFEAICKQFQESNFEHEDDLLILVQEKNATALDRGLDALLQYLKNGSKLKNISDFASFLIEKCITSAKTSTKQKAQEILLNYVESNNNNIFIEQICSRMKNEKNAKTKAACIEIFREAIVQFGAQEVPFKDALSCITTLLDDTDKKVRTETQSLVVEMYKWVKDAIRPKLESIRPAQLKDLEVEFEKYKTSPTPEPKRTKKSSQLSASAPVTGPSSKKSAPAFDPMDLYEAEPVFNKIPSSFFEQVADSNWKNRRDALTELNTLVNKPKIQNGNYTELISKLGKIIEMDTNVAVIKLSLDAITHIANGLRSDFVHGSKILYPTLFSKLKDKNKIMCESISNLILTLHQHCISIFDVIDDSETSAFIASINSKIASQKLLTMKIIEKCITAEQLNLVNKNTLYKRGIKIVVKQLTGLCEDASAEVRSLCFKLLRDLSIPESGVEKEAQALLAKYDKNKEATTTITAPVAAPATEVRPSTPINQKPTKKPTNSKGNSAATSSTADDTEKGAISNEDALNICNESFSSLLNGKFMEQIGSKVWKERLEAFEVLENYLSENGEAQLKSNPSLCEAVIRYIVQSTNSLKESNMQILCKVLNIINWVCKNAPVFSKFLIVFLISSGILEKISTPKVKDITGDCLTSFTRVSGIQFVFGQLYKALETQKNPKTVSDCIEWMEFAVRAFGVRSLKVDLLIEFIKKVGLENNNPVVKKQTTKLLCTLKLYLGDGLLDFFKDVKATLLSSIKKEFEQMTETEAPEPTEVSSTSNTVGSSDSLLPRVDISQSIPKLLKDLENSAWKIRLDALTAIEKTIIDANKRILNNNAIMDLMNGLRKRLEQETNMKIVTTILSLLQLIATSVGANNGLEKYVKIIFPTILSKQMNDNKKNVRQLSIDVMEFWSVDLQVTASPFLKQINKFLSNADAKKSNADGRRELLSFVLKHFSQCTSCLEDVHALIKPVLDALLEPKVELRKVAETLVAEMIKVVGEDTIKKIVKDVKPTSSRDSLLTLFEKYVSVDGSDFDAMEVDNQITTAPAITTTITPAMVAIVDYPLPQQQQQQQIITGIFNSILTKEMRMKKKIKWYFENQVRLDLFDCLKDMFRQSLQSLELFDMLFSANPKRVHDALVYFVEQFNAKEYILHLDILLQYCTVRLSDQTNTANLNKTLEFLNKLFIALREENYMLSDYESSSFVPIFLDRMGHNMTSVREAMKKIFKLTKFVCQARKLFHYLYDCLKLSKNTRTRCDCLIELVEIMEQSSINSLLGTANIQSFVIVLAKFVGDVDMVRVPALQCIALVNQEYPNEVKACLEQSVEISTVIKTIIFDKLKKKKQTEEESTISSSIPPTTITPSTLVSNNTTFVTTNTSISTLINSINQYRVDEELAVVSLKKLVDIVKNESRLVVPNLKDIIACMTSNIQNSFISATQLNNTRICKYLLNTMMQLFGQRSIVEFVSKESLQMLVDQLLTRLLDENLTKLEEGQMFLKALNTLMLKILENSNRTQTYTSLITLLAESFGEERKKYTELVVKCLLKLTKALSSTIDRIDVDILLMDLHEFLTNNPPTQFKGKDDLPLRTVKTILNELVKVKGTSIRTHLNLIPTHKNPLIVSYIDLMLNNTKTTEASVAVAEAPKPVIQRSATPTVSMAATSAIIAPLEDSELATIFNRIGNKETTQEGLQLLYKYQKQHPEADVTPFLSKCSEPFQAFIKKQLMKIEQQETKNSPRRLVGYNSALLNSIDDKSSIEPKYSNLDAARNKYKLKNMQSAEQQSVDSSLEPLKKRLNSTLTDLDYNKLISRKSPTEDKENSAPALTTGPTSDLKSLKERLERLKSREHLV